MSERIVYVVHCVDTEGPLCEPLEATFERLVSVFSVDIEATEENLRKLQNCEVDLGGIEDAVATMVAPELISYKDSWKKIDTMLADIMSETYRHKYGDSFGNGWVYNWFCGDHVGYTRNPRGRDLGYNKVLEHYQGMVKKTGSEHDGLHFHYHPMPFTKQANHCATHWFAHSDTLYQVFARRLIDIQWFPSVNRPGFHVTRPDSHWFLEQFVPFDYANQATNEDCDQPDLDGGRFGDWRRAQMNWQSYHPSYDDYQVPGNSRRSVFRCLNVGTRTRLLRQEDVDQAFSEADQGLPTVVAFTDHDYRDMRPDVEMVYDMLIKAQKKFPDVSFCHSEAREAARKALNLSGGNPCDLDVQLHGSSLHIESQQPTFGPQPFLALKTKSGEYYHDNLDIHAPHYRWGYVFDDQNVPLDNLEAIGVGTANAEGDVSVVVTYPHSGEVVKKTY